MPTKKIILGSDHAGFKLKEAIKKFLIKEGYEVDDLGASSYNHDDDYPEFIFKAAKKVAQNPNSKGIIFGGSGQGEAIVANKVKGIRAALYYGGNLDIVKLSRIHNDVRLWLNTGFSNEERHKRRVKQISQIEEKICK